MPDHADLIAAATRRLAECVVAGEKALEAEVRLAAAVRKLDPDARNPLLVLRCQKCGWGTLEWHEHSGSPCPACGGRRFALEREGSAPLGLTQTSSATSPLFAAAAPPAVPAASPAELKKAAEAAHKELCVWLDANECECDLTFTGHVCGRPRVEGVRDRLRAALDAPAAVPSDEILEIDEHGTVHGDPRVIAGLRRRPVAPAPPAETVGAAPEGEQPFRVEQRYGMFKVVAFNGEEIDHAGSRALADNIAAGLNRLFAAYAAQLNAVSAPPAMSEERLDGVGLIAAERRRQVESEGWTPEHDDEHDDGALAVAAASLAVDGTDARIDDPAGVDDGGDRWGLVAKHGYRGSRPDRVRALAIAGALLAAEIDRVSRRAALDRKAGTGEARR